MLQNPLSFVDVTSTSVLTSGFNLTVNIPIIYKPGYAGTLTLFVSASNTAGNSNWVAFGTWTVPNETISTPSAPSGAGSGTIGTSLSYSTGGAASNYGHSVQYQFNCRERTHPDCIPTEICHACFS